MFRRLLALLSALSLAPVASAQGLSAFFATGTGDTPSSFAYSFNALSADPIAVALNQFNVTASDPSAISVTNLGTGAAVVPGDISPVNPLLLTFGNGGVALGGGSIPSWLTVSSPTSALAVGSTPNLSISLTNPEGGHAGSVSYTVSDTTSDLVGGATLPIPDGGWWVLGFGSPESFSVGPDLTPKGDGPASTPEPATLLLAGVGLAGVAGLRRWKRAK